MDNFEWPMVLVGAALFANFAIQLINSLKAWKPGSGKSEELSSIHTDIRDLTRSIHELALAIAGLKTETRVIESAIADSLKQIQMVSTQLQDTHEHVNRLEWSLLKKGVIDKES